MSALRFVRSVLALSGLALLGAAQTTPIVLPNSSATQFLKGDDLEGELNCDEVLFARCNLASIVQDVPVYGPEFAAAMRRRAKTLLEAAVLGSNSVLHDYYQQGVLAGLEFDWFFPHGNQAPTSYRLPGVVEVFAPTERKEPQLVARIFGYDASQYVVRRAAVQAMIMHPIRVYTVWAGDVLCTGGVEPLTISGLANEFHGRTASGSSFVLGGMHNQLLDGVLATGGAFINPRNQVGRLVHEDLSAMPWVPFSEASARSLALASGTYAAGELLIDDGNLPPQGVVFAEGQIVVRTSAATGAYTFVSATGAVRFLGDADAFGPFLEDVLAVSFAERIVLAGDHNQFLGELHAPHGRLEVSGSGNTLLGILVGAEASISGSGNVVTDGTHPIPLP